MKITIRNLQKKIPIDPESIKKAARKVFSAERINKAAEISVSLVGDRRIRKLNLDYLKESSSTDVLTFDLSCFKNEIIADIVICADTAVRNARIFKTTPLSEIHLYLIHGLLHIFGYDDKTAEQRKAMDKRARRILLSLR